MSKKLRILVVDDNPEFCQNLADILETEGCETATAYDGFKALEVCGKCVHISCAVYLIGSFYAAVGFDVYAGKRLKTRRQRLGFCLA